MSPDLQNTSHTKEARPSFLKWTKIIIIIIITGSPCNIGGRVKWLKKKKKIPGSTLVIYVMSLKHTHSVWPTGFTDHILRASQHPPVGPTSQTHSGDKEPAQATVSLLPPQGVWAAALFNVDSTVPGSREALKNTWWINEPRHTISRNSKCKDTHCKCL